MYRKNTDVLAHFDPGEEHGGKMQMMAIGERRFLFQARRRDRSVGPAQAEAINKKGFGGSQLQLAYNNKLGKWILMTGAGVAGTFSTPQWPLGKYDNLISSSRTSIKKACAACASMTPPIRRKNRAALGVELRPRRSQARDSNWFGHAPQFLRRRTLRLSRHRARQ